MWLARIFGRVTSAETAALGSSASKSRFRKFKRSLTWNRIPENPNAFIADKGFRESYVTE
jgi:hypothetical protein